MSPQYSDRLDWILPTVQHSPDHAYIVLFLVVDGEREALGQQPVIAKDLSMATDMMRERVNVTEEGVEKVFAEARIESRVEHFATGEVRQRGGQYP
jgi:hypothetical protein